MSLAEYFPIWDRLTGAERDTLEGAVTRRAVDAGTVLHNGDADCIGLLLVRPGQLRAYMLSPQGREVTLYRLLDRDICLFSASCMMPDIQFDLVIEAEKESEVWVIPPEVYKDIMSRSAALATCS